MPSQPLWTDGLLHLQLPCTTSATPTLQLPADVTRAAATHPNQPTPSPQPLAPPLSVSPTAVLLQATAAAGVIEGLASQPSQHLPKSEAGRLPPKQSDAKTNVEALAPKIARPDNQQKAPTTDTTAPSTSAAATSNASNQRGTLQALQMLFPQELQHRLTAPADAPDSDGKRHVKAAIAIDNVSSQSMTTETGIQVVFYKDRALVSVVICFCGCWPMLALAWLMLRI